MISTPEWRETPKEFIDAIREGDVERVKEMLGKNVALVKTRAQFDLTPLHWAVSQGPDDKYAEITRELLNHGADVHALDDQSRTPLHMAVTWRSTKIVQTLLLNGADEDLDVKSSSGKSPKELAAPHDAIMVHINQSLKKRAEWQERLRMEKVLERMKDVEVKTI